METFDDAKRQEMLKEVQEITATEIPEIYIDDKTRLIYENKLTEAKLNFSKDASPDNLIWLGRRLAYLGKYDEAIEIYSKGIIKYPVSYTHLTLPTNREV